MCNTKVQKKTINTLLPNDMESNFRKTHYKNVLDVLDGEIYCTICNTDLKKSIILNDHILLHKIFLCLCCKECFEKLSNSQNGCIFCSREIKLKTCQVCNSNMCERCIDNHCSTSKHSSTLKGCVRCSTNALWIHRSQAAAILQCFSFELDLRLLLSGEESEDKHNLYEFIINSTKCVEFSPNDTNLKRVKYFNYLLNSKIQLAFYDYQNMLLKTQDLKKCVEHFTDLCELILKSTCEILLDFKCLFNEEIVESLNNKVKSILRNSILFKKTKNATKKIASTSYEALSYSSNKFLIDNELLNLPTSNSSISLEKQKNEIVTQKKNLSNMGKSEIVNKNIICITLNSTNEVDHNGFHGENVKNDSQKVLGEIKEFEINSKNNESNTFIKSVSDELPKISVNPTVHKNIEKKIGTIGSCYEENYYDLTDEDLLNERYVLKMLDDDTIVCEVIDGKKSDGEDGCPKINLTRCAQIDINNDNVGESEKLNVENSWPKIYLTRCDQKDIDSLNKKEPKEKLDTDNSWPRIYLTRCDQKNIESSIKKDSEKMDVKNSWPRIYLTRCDQKDIENSNKKEPLKEESKKDPKNNVDSKAVKVTKKRKFQEKPNSKQTYLKYKKL